MSANIRPGEKIELDLLPDGRGVLKAARPSGSIRALLAASNVEVNRPAMEAGLSILEANGDFADGVIADEGNWLGGETFVSFDKRAVALLTAAGQSARQL